MRISAAVTEARGAAFTLGSLELDEPRPAEVVVRMVGSGICHTDLAVRDQKRHMPLPAVLGHEGAGVVEAVGDGVTHVGPGDHVVLTFNSCGGCRMCAQGRPAYCDLLDAHNFAGLRADGTTPLHRESGDVHGVFFGQSAFATHALANERNVVKVDPNVPLVPLAPLGCGFQTGAGAVLNSLRPSAGSTVVVFGAGSVGLCAVMAAVVAGCTTVVAVDVNGRRLELAREVGATHVHNGTESDTASFLRELTAGLGADFTVDTTGAASVLRQAVDVLNQGGVCGLIGGSAPGTEVSLDMRTLLLGRSVRGIIEGDSVPRLFIPRLVELYRQGRYPFDKLIGTYAFEDINQAVEDMEKGAVVKPVLTFHREPHAMPPGGR
ncbi:NAD(P)-dependent alcohol dehydrogenase [Streptomyces sp. NPDC049910]|uniref:NAD(P)-dependent alcohol dehydrogenase n=1 Tax=Streptomyces sp. NPDC049910 TaxID=3155278 RepID=UPI003417B201